MIKGADAVYSFFANNVGVFFMLLAIVVWLAIWISKAFIKLQKNKTDNILCQVHDAAIKKTDRSMIDLHKKIDTLCADIKKISKSVAVLSNDNVSSVLWAKAEPVFRYLKDEMLRVAVLYKIRSFIEFADKASRDIESGLGEEVIFTSMKLGADDVSDYILDKCGKDYHANFMDSHSKRMVEYKSNIKAIINDPVNNHKQRFIDLSSSFMNEFLSEMINSWMAINGRLTPSIISSSIDIDTLAERINKQYEESADAPLF